MNAAPARHVPPLSIAPILCMLPSTSAARCLKCVWSLSALLHCCVCSSCLPLPVAAPACVHVWGCLAAVHRINKRFLRRDYGATRWNAAASRGCSVGSRFMLTWSAGCRTTAIATRVTRGGCVVRHAPRATVPALYVQQSNAPATNHCDARMKCRQQHHGSRARRQQSDSTQRPTHKRLAHSSVNRPPWRTAPHSTVNACV